MRMNGLLISALATLWLTGCNNGSQATQKNADSDSTVVENTAVSDSQDEATPAEEPYDLEAIAKVLKGCDYAFNFENGVAQVKKGDEYFFIDKMGRITERPERTESNELEVKYDEATGLKGFVNQSGEWVIRPQFEYCGTFSEGLCWVTTPESNGGIGFIDTTGKMVIPCEFEWAVEHQPCDFHEGLCPVIVLPENECFGYIDKTGKRAFPGIYSYEADFSEGLAGVREVEELGDGFVKSKRSGYIDKTGEMVLVIDETDQAPHCGEFHEGIAKVRAYNKAWFIDKTGKKLFELDPEEYYTGDTSQFSEGLMYVCSKNRGPGFFDKNFHSTFDY